MRVAYQRAAATLRPSICDVAAGPEFYHLRFDHRGSLILSTAEQFAPKAQGFVLQFEIARVRDGAL
jgi:hypothetical protein